VEVRVEQALQDIFGALPRIHRGIIPSLDDPLDRILDNDLRDLTSGSAQRGLSVKGGIL
jgi:hypothetical protein